MSSFSTELAAGKLDAGEDIFTTASRELLHDLCITRRGRPDLIPENDSTDIRAVRRMTHSAAALSAVRNANRSLVSTPGPSAQMAGPVIGRTG